MSIRPDAVALTDEELDQLLRGSIDSGYTGWTAALERIIADRVTAERVATADRIATQLARKTCSPTCEHPTCTSYRYAAHIARQHGTGLRVPRQTGPRP